MIRLPVKPFATLPTAALALALSAVPTAASAADFRGSNWGDTQAAVKARESKPLHHDVAGELAYWNFELAGVPSGLTYKFEDDRLVEAYFYSRHRTSDIHEDWADFEAYRDQSAEHFDDPGETAWSWSDSVPPQERSPSVEAVAAGLAVHTVTWIRPTSRVELRIEGSGGGIDLVRTTFRPLE